MSIVRDFEDTSGMVVLGTLDAKWTSIYSARDLSLLRSSGPAPPRCSLRRRPLVRRSALPRSWYVRVLESSGIPFLFALTRRITYLDKPLKK